MRKRLLRLIATAFWLAWLLSPLAAQVPGSGDLLLRVVTTCGTLPAVYTAGQDRFAVMDINGNFCTAASVSASIAGFAPGAAFANLTATGSSADVALPAGTVVLFQNTGITAVSCTLSIGAGTAVANENIIQPASWLAFTVGSNTHGSCIDQTGSVSNVVVLTGGSGIPTGSGGGSGGGGGAITAASGAFASGSLAVGSGTDGWNVTEGAKADAAWVSGSGSIVAVLKAIANGVTGSIPAGTNLIGKTGIDQTTPGSTNAVSPVAAAVGGATPSSAIAPATPAGVNLKASAGTLYGAQCTTIQATPVYVKIYDSSSAPTCGSGTPVLRYMCPAAATAANGAGSNPALPAVGVLFASGIGYCVTGALADADTTAITASNTLVNFEWK
jgi:hypothetical protein